MRGGVRLGRQLNRTENLRHQSIPNQERYQLVEVGWNGVVPRGEGPTVGYGDLPRGVIWDWRVQGSEL